MRVLDFLGERENIYSRISPFSSFCPCSIVNVSISPQNNITITNQQKSPAIDSHKINTHCVNSRVHSQDSHYTIISATRLYKSSNSSSMMMSRDDRNDDVPFMSYFGLNHHHNNHRHDPLYPLLHHHHQNPPFTPTPTASSPSSSSDDGSTYLPSPSDDRFKYQPLNSSATHYLHPLSPDHDFDFDFDFPPCYGSHPDINAKMLDELALSQNFSKLNVRDLQPGGLPTATRTKGLFGIGSHSNGYGFGFGLSDDGFLFMGGGNQHFSSCPSEASSPQVSFNGGGRQNGVYDSMPSFAPRKQFSDLEFGYDSLYAFGQKNEQDCGLSNRNISLANPSPDIAWSKQYAMNPDNAYSRIRDQELVQSKMYAYKNLMEGLTTLHGNSSNQRSNIKAHDSRKGSRKGSTKEISAQNNRGKVCTFHGGVKENGQRPSAYGMLPRSSFPGEDASFCQVQGHVYLMAKDQNGCRFLQRIFDEGTSRDVWIIFHEIVDHVVELSLNQFGNYVIQKMLDVCDEEQKLQLVFELAKEPGQLVKISLNTYGTRVVQRLIETLNTRQQILLVVLALKPGLRDVVEDQNGNHVLQSCLKYLSNEDNKFIFDAATKFCVDIGTHQHGCCVMQKCIDHFRGKYLDKLVTEISKHALLLAQHPFGNYVVQHIIEKDKPGMTAKLLPQFEGHFVQLSMQKCSSNVVERFVKHSEESRSLIIHELISVSHFDQLLQDPFANYVIQTALVCTKGALHSLLVDAIRPHSRLRTSPYCKRIFTRNKLKK